MKKHFDTLVCPPDKLSEELNNVLEKCVDVKIINSMVGSTTLGVPVLITTIEISFSDTMQRGVYLASKNTNGINLKVS